MLITVPGVLTGDQVALVQSQLKDASFTDGRLSAGLAARQVKQNEEASLTTDELNRLNNIVMGSLVQHPVYRQAALPLKVASPYYARYTEGMSYGDHVDDPIMQVDATYRSDVSITIFLNDPADYDGGELVIRSTYGETAVKLAAGDAVMYPSSSVHHINPVTRGMRLVAVTWLQSLVRDAAQRELLYELNHAREHLMQSDPNSEVTRQVDRSYVNLVRMWGEP